VSSGVDVTLAHGTLFKALPCTVGGTPHPPLLQLPAPAPTPAPVMRRLSCLSSSPFDATPTPPYPRCTPREHKKDATRARLMTLKKYVTGSGRWSWALLKAIRVSWSTSCEDRRLRLVVCTWRNRLNARSSHAADSERDNKRNQMGCQSKQRSPWSRHQLLRWRRLQLSARVGCAARVKNLLYSLCSSASRAVSLSSTDAIPTSRNSDSVSPTSTSRIAHRKPATRRRAGPQKLSR